MPNKINSEVIIAEFKPEYKNHFKELNFDWIYTYFEPEENDEKSLNHPEETILNKGGKIFFALLEEKVVGTCALLKIDEKIYELAKMAVDKNARGKKIGQKLCEAAIEKARRLGAETVVLESNTILIPAINLYKKLGFIPVEKFKSDYKRSNIKMKLDLK
jgi:GNAT superfamily N-acetyltransferase